MAPRSETKVARLQAWLDEHRPEQIGHAELKAIGEALAPVSDRYLRELLRHSATPLHPIVEGVVQDDFEHLERTLTALANVYLGGDRQRSRQIVITAKDHARFALRRMPLGPRPSGLMASLECIEFLPKILVENWLLG